MRSAIKRRSHSASLIFEAIQHPIDGNRECVELIMRARYGKPAPKIPRDDARTGLCDIANAARQFEAEPEARERCGQSGYPDSPQGGSPELVGETAPLRDVGAHEKVIPSRKRPHGRSHRMHGAS